MQEEVENRTVNLAISTTKLTGRTIIAGIRKYLQHREKVKMKKARDPAVHGKQSVKQLLGQNQGATNVEIDKESIRDFEKLAKKYGVDFAVRKDKSFSFPRIRHIRQLIWGNIQLFCKDLSVTCSLVQHQDKITVLKDIFNFPAGKKIFDILGDTTWNTTPFTESLPDFYRISCCLFFFEQKVEFIDIVPGRFDATVDCNSVSGTSRLDR